MSLFKEREDKKKSFNFTLLFFLLLLETEPHYELLYNDEEKQQRPLESNIKANINGTDSKTDSSAAANNNRKNNAPLNSSSANTGDEESAVSRSFVQVADITAVDINNVKHSGKEHHAHKLKKWLFTEKIYNKLKKK
jgi:hypothetical protein